jgi:hypothetical protein
VDRVHGLGAGGRVRRRREGGIQRHRVRNIEAHRRDRLADAAQAGVDLAQ